MLIKLVNKLDSPNWTVSYLEFSLSENFEFKAWQFVMLSYQDKKRAYSIASTAALARDWKIWFYVKKASENWMSDFLTQKIKIWEQIEMSKSFGHMILPENPWNFQYLLISVWSGLAPIFSIFQTLFQEKTYKSLNQFYGERYMENIVPEIFNQMNDCRQENVQNFVYLSRQENEKTWKWYVQNWFKDVLDKLDNLSELKVYICWKPSIVDEITDILVNYWILASNIKSEKF